MSYVINWLLAPPEACTTSPVLGHPLQLLPAQPRLRDVCLKVMSPDVFWPLSLALRVPRQNLSYNIVVWLSQGEAKQLVLLSDSLMPSILCHSCGGYRTDL